MKMLRTKLGLSLLALMILGLASCTQSNCDPELDVGPEPLQDGIYSIDLQQDSYGWAPTISIECRDDAIIAVSYDEYKQTDGGERIVKSRNVEYAARWKAEHPEAPFQQNLDEVYSVLEQQLLESSREALRVDGVSGASSTSNRFRQAVCAIVKQAQ